MKRVLISFLMILTVLFLNIYTSYYEVKADVGDYLDVFDGLKNIVEIIGADEDIAPEILRDATYACVYQGMGIIPKYGAIAEMEWMRKGWAKALNYIYGGNDKNEDNLTQEDYNKLGEYITNNITVNDNGDITINSNMHNFLMGFSEELDINYLWSYTADDLAGLFSSVDAYIEAKKLMGSDLVANEYYFLCSYYGINKLYSVSKSNYPYLFINGTSQTVNKSNNYAWGNMINGSDNTSISMDVYNWDGTNKEWVSAGTGLITCYGLIDISKSINHETATNQRAFFLSNTSHIKIRYITGTATVPDIIYQPYYYNNDVWQDFSSSSGDYTWSPSNINTVTYGDITEYIDNSNTENGYPPSVQEIEVNIKNEDTNNKDDSGGGGGSGSGGDDSGGGSGGGIGSVGDIFGWLKQLGSVIASLIKGVGEFLTEVITGLVSAITDLISGIGDLIVSITETLPTTFMTWFGTLFEWMPTEWKALLSASLVFMVLWGIIKLIRG